MMLFCIAQARGKQPTKAERNKISKNGSTMQEHVRELVQKEIQENKNLSSKHKKHLILQPEYVYGISSLFPRWLIFVENDESFLKRIPLHKMTQNDLRKICIVALSCHGKLDCITDLESLYLINNKFNDNEKYHASTITFLLHQMVTTRECWVKSTQKLGQINTKVGSNQHKSKSVGANGMVRWIQSAAWRKHWDSREKNNDDQNNMFKMLRNKSKISAIAGGTTNIDSAKSLFAPLLPRTSK